VRFAVPRPGIPVASPRSHGVPRRDVPCRVHVSIAGITAGGAPEGGLALARLPVHLPARRAHLACVRGVDLFDSAGSLLLQATDQQAPSRPHNASIKSGLLADVATWVFPCASGGLRHVPDLETFYPDQVKPAGNVRTGLFGPILSPICVAGAQPGDRMLHPCAAVRLGPCAGQLPLQPPQPLPHRGSEADRVQQFSCRQRRRHRHSLAPRRPPRRIPRIEEESQGAREISQRLLLHRLTSCGQPIMLGPCLGELPTLLQIAGSAPAARPPVSMLLNGEVPHVAGMGAVIAQHRFLGGRGQQAIPRHTNTLTIATDISREVKRRTLPALEGRFPAPRFS
jgi:hypothetical protein